MFEISWGDGGRVVMAGRFDASQADKAEAFLSAIQASVDVDFHDLQYISSLGLGILLRTQKRLAASGATLRLVRVSRHIREIFRFSGFDRIFPIEEEASEQAR
ncbi:MAG TPA: STAS domain-containing protein [Candidatus Polarisedimenticolaceae bacterium]|nr:STAS domain-containing protein [Candidatus Polarisedimenticolaceae bacterium]